MNFEIRKPVTRASTTSSGKRKRSGSEDTDTLKFSTTRQDNGKTGKQLTGQICGRCQELKIPVNLAQDVTVLTVPSSGGEAVIGPISLSNMACALSRRRGREGQTSTFVIRHRFPVHKRLYCLRILGGNIRTWL